MAHQVTQREDGTYGIERLSSGAVYGRFDTFADALEAMCEAGLSDRRAVADPAQY